MKRIKIALLIIICLGIGFIFGLLIYNKKDNKSINISKDKKEILEYDKSQVNTNIIENLKSKGIKSKYLNDLKLLFKFDYEDRKIFQYDDIIYNYGLFTDDNKKSIYLDYANNLLSFKKPDTKYSNDDSYYVYKLDNYYLLVIDDSVGDGGKFKIFDKDLKELFADLEEGQMAITDNALYYSTYECAYNNGISQKEVHRLNLNTMQSSFDFYLDHLAGWKC